MRTAGTCTAALALLLALLVPARPLAHAAAGEGPRTLFVWFADGGRPPVAGRVCTAGTPPAFRCKFADNAACRARIFDLLRTYYAPYNITVTDTQPASPPYYSVVVTETDHGAWCIREPGGPDLGYAPYTCTDWYARPDNTAYVLHCPDAHRCALTIAQENAHAMGLIHTMSAVDIMTPTYTPSQNRYEDRDNRTYAPNCGRATQNSHQMVLAALGPREPGVPVIAGSMGTGGAPTSGGTGPGSGAGGTGGSRDAGPSSSPGHGGSGGGAVVFSRDASATTTVIGRDAGVGAGADAGQTAPPSPAPPSIEGGCAVAFAARPDACSPGALAVFVATAFTLARAPRRGRRRRDGGTPA